jgi:hypothetical protein
MINAVEFEDSVPQLQVLFERDVTSPSASGLHFLPNYINISGPFSGSHHTTRLL